MKLTHIKTIHCDLNKNLINVDHVSFKEVSISEIEKELRELNSNKATTFSNIPTKNKVVKVVLIHYKNFLMMHEGMVTSQIN